MATWYENTTGTGFAANNILDIDVRAVVHSIPVPTPIIHRDRDAITPIERARYMSRQIPGARLVELAGERSPLTGRQVTLPHPRQSSIRPCGGHIHESERTP